MGNIDLNLKYTQNRELSWLKFNERVLNEATDSTVPLLERLNFISIYQANLDEFFMIRIGSLFTLKEMEKGKHSHDPRSGYTYKEQIDKAYLRIHVLNNKKDEIYNDVTNKLAIYGIKNCKPAELKKKEYIEIKSYFTNNVLPILSPQVIDAHHPFPHILNKRLHIGVNIKKKKNNIIGIIPIPDSLPQIYVLKNLESIKFVNMENLILEFADSVFSSYEIEEKVYFCLTRNADINLSSDDESFDIPYDLRKRIEQLLKERNRMQVVRIEISSEISKSFKDFLLTNFKIYNHQVFISKAPMNLTYASSLIKYSKIKNMLDLIYSKHSPRVYSNLNYRKSLISQVLKKDVLLSYPYESIETYIRLIKDCVYNESVISIKITIYRLASSAKIVDYLCMASENGKQVTALIELRARFDEQNNINWSERLEKAGVNVQYGFDKYKVHSKICLITLKQHGEIKYITQIGTGNYNETTAALYTDLSLITGNQEIGKDASEFFKNMELCKMEGNYSTLLTSPNQLKKKVIKLIKEQEILGEKGIIKIKINSITDTDIIFALKNASCAGTKIFLIVRGICCILPKVPNATENISISQVIGRYLEHSRIYSFGYGDNNKMYISSADFMTRNTENRVEVAAPIFDKTCKDKLNRIFEAIDMDNTKARDMNHLGDFNKRVVDKKIYDSQKELIYDSEKVNLLTMGEKNNENNLSSPRKLLLKFKELFGRGL